MGVAIELRGRVKAGPAPKELLAQAATWLRAHCQDLLDRCQEVDVDGTPWLVARLHPIAEDVRLGALPGGEVLAQAKTSPVGPGYHIYMCETLRRLGTALRIEWDRAASLDDSGYLQDGQAAAVERTMQVWIADVSRRVLFLPPGSGAVALSMPSDTVFHAEAHVLTPLGPRDTEWLRKVAADELSARDFFAWWSGEVGPEMMRARALCLMWTDVRWHPPASDEEREVLVTVSRWLERAHRLDISLDYPWREWAEVLRALGQDKGPLFDMIERRAARVPEGTPLVGYRRGPVSLQLPAGWRVTVPGSFSLAVDGGTVRCGHGSRALTLAPVPRTINGESAETLLALPEAGRDAATSAGPEDEVYANEAGALRARCRIRVREGQGGYRLSGAVATTSALARLTIDFETEAEKKWALLTFASVTHE